MPEEKKLITPGPGQYKTRPASNMTKKQQSIFTSQTNWFEDMKQAKIKRKVPAIGQYELNQHTIEYELKKKTEKVNQNPFVNAKDILVPFSSKQERFLNLHKDENEQYRGPGYYDVTHELHSKSPKKEGVHQAFNSTKQWFTNQPPDIPGPGDYENTQQLKWFKKSYNMIFAE